jgi:hypothetical protein
MEYFPSALDRPQSDDFAERIEAGFIALGYGSGLSSYREKPNSSATLASRGRTSKRTSRRQ